MTRSALALLLTLAAAPAPGASEAGGAGPAASAQHAKDGKDALEAQRAALAREVMPLAERLQREIEAGDVKALLAWVPPEGLRCAGRVVPRAHVEHDLRTEGTWLHAVLFGGPGAPAPPGQPTSLQAFFAGARELAVIVAFREDPRSPVGMPCLDFRAKGTVTPGAPFCLERRAGRWWLAESLYPC